MFSSLPLVEHRLESPYTRPAPAMGLVAFCEIIVVFVNRISDMVCTDESLDVTNSEDQHRHCKSNMLSEVQNSTRQEPQLLSGVSQRPLATTPCFSHGDGGYLDLCITRRRLRHFDAP